MTPTPSTPRSARGAHPTRPGRPAALALAGAALVFGASCSESAPTDVQGDSQPPTVVLSRASGADTTVAFSVQVSDELGIKYVNVAVGGEGLAAAFGDTLRTTQTKFAKQYSVRVPSGTPAGAPVTVVASVADGAGHVSAGTLLLATGNVAPSLARITSPATRDTAAAGGNVRLGLVAGSGSKVAAVGYTVTGAFTFADTTRFGSPFRDSVATIDTLAIPASASGQATVTAFMIDSLNRYSAGSSIVLTIVNAANIRSTPVVTFGLTERVEVSDTVQVSARDVSNIATLGYEVRDTTGATVLDSASVTRTGKMFSPDFERFTMRIPPAYIGRRVIVRAHARNAGGTSAFAGGSVVRSDTVLVVAGQTKSLPGGGRVADVYFHAGKDRLYLSNIDRNRLEVFDFAGFRFFDRGIDVGSRPWGLAPWPRSRDGSAGDTVLVANSGGTTISYVDLNRGTDGAGREVYRYGLPNIVAYSVTTQKNSTTGVLFQQRTVYDFSDRPQYLGATCQAGAGDSDPCGDVVLVYSTQPTAGQTLPFPNKGTVRWENLTRRTSHFFFEQAVGTSADRADTLEIERFAAKDGNGVLLGADSMLMRYRDTTAAGVAYSTVAEVEKLGFTDTTFVRNSGNFRRAVVGEGGPVANSRSMMYDVSVGMQMTPLLVNGQVTDRGVSRSTDVRDFIANTSTNVFGAAINFDGELAAIRGNSSTALIGSTLRLQGMLITSAANPGFDFHPRNRGTNSLPSTRLAFAASAEPQIDIFDSYCYQRVAIVPVRDPIIGPIKSARRQNGQLVLIGATARGVVIATLADSFTTSCQQP